MRDLSSLAEQIRAVRQAQRQFIGRWQLDQIIMGPKVLDHLAEAMAAAHRELDDSRDVTRDGDPVHATSFEICEYSRHRLWSM